MQSPEILLQDMNAALRELYGAAQLLDDERLNAELPLVVRRLLLAEVLGTTSILAIGGSQGAGKATLVESLYALGGEDAQWLQPKGRGEKIPMLVLEDAAHGEGSRCASPADQGGPSVPSGRGYCRYCCLLEHTIT